MIPATLTLRGVRDEDVTQAISGDFAEVIAVEAHVRTRQSYGFDVGVGRIERLRKQMGICCKQTRKFKATTNSSHGLPVAENLLQIEIYYNRQRGHSKLGNLAPVVFAQQLQQQAAA